MPGCVYVTEYLNGEVKVGRTSNIEQRLTALSINARHWDSGLRRCWRTTELLDSVSAERAALDAVERRAGLPRRGEETFVAAFDDVVQWTADAIGAGGEDVPAGSWTACSRLSQAGMRWLWQNADELSMTDVRVMFFLLDVVDHDGYSVATIAQIAKALNRCESNISASLKKLITTGRIERQGRSGFRISYSVLHPKGGLEAVQPRRLDEKRAS